MKKAGNVINLNKFLPGDGLMQHSFVREITVSWPNPRNSIHGFQFPHRIGSILYDHESGRVCQIITSLDFMVKNKNPF